MLSLRWVSGGERQRWRVSRGEERREEEHTETKDNEASLISDVASRTSALLLLNFKQQ